MVCGESVNGVCERCLEEEAAGGGEEAGGGTASKVRTPRKDVGEKGEASGRRAS